MLSFMGQGQMGKLGKLATFACLKRISENPNCLHGSVSSASQPILPCPSVLMSRTQGSKRFVFRCVQSKTVGDTFVHPAETSLPALIYVFNEILTKATYIKVYFLCMIFISSIYHNGYKVEHLVYMFNLCQGHHNCNLLPS